MSVLDCFCPGCSRRVELSAQQLHTIRTCSGEDGNEVVLIPIGEWRFTMWNERLIAICPDDAKTLPPVIGYHPLVGYAGPAA